MAHPEQQRSTWRLRAAVRRWVLILLVGGQTVMAGNFLLQVLPYHGGTPVEAGIVILFALLYIWISFGFWMAVYGFLLRRFGGDQYSLANRHSSSEIDAAPLSRTAVIMPIRSEEHTSELQSRPHLVC